MNHSTYILTEFSQPSPLNRLITQMSILSGAKESGKTEDQYLKYIEDEMKFQLLNKLKLRTQQGDVMFYNFGGVK